MALNMYHNVINSISSSNVLLILHAIPVSLTQNVFFTNSQMYVDVLLFACVLSASVVSYWTRSGAICKPRLIRPATLSPLLSKGQPTVLGANGTPRGLRSSPRMAFSLRKWRTGDKYTAYFPPV